MRVTIVEGTVAEIREAFPHLNTPSEAVLLKAPEPKEHPSDQGGGTCVSLAMARKVISRLPLSAQQKVILSTIYKAHPEPVTAAALQKVTRYSPSQFAGMMGAFGRRLSHTAGYVPDSRFVDWERDDAAKSWKYTLPETVREALRLEGVV